MNSKEECSGFTNFKDTVQVEEKSSPMYICYQNDLAIVLGQIFL